jgi:hypothetical protein
MVLLGQSTIAKHQPGFIYTLALILARDLFYSPEDAADIDWHEHLNVQELTFLVGLFVKREIDFTMTTEEASAEHFERIYQLFLELHKKHGEQFVKDLAANFPLKPASLRGAGRSFFLDILFHSAIFRQLTQETRRALTVERSRPVPLSAVVVGENRRGC